MKDTIRWTAKKIASRLPVLEPFVYRKKEPLSSFFYKLLLHYQSTLPSDLGKDGEDWTEIAPNTYWGEWNENFALKGHFQIPGDWDPIIPTALYLPLGASGDFCHPEALVFIDGMQCASCDRFHQEVELPASFYDHEEHSIYLSGWTGLGDIEKGLKTKLYMNSCYIVQIDQQTRDFIARIASGIGDCQ